jgi:hypothetical protein
MDTIMNYLDAHPYVFLGLIIVFVIYIIWMYLCIVGWCVHTVQNPQSGFFKKGLAVMIGMLLLKNVMGMMYGQDQEKKK